MSRSSISGKILNIDTTLSSRYYIFHSRCSRDLYNEIWQRKIAIHEWRDYCGEHKRWIRVPPLFRMFRNKYFDLEWKFTRREQHYGCASRVVKSWRRRTSEMRLYIAILFSRMTCEVCDRCVPLANAFLIASQIHDYLFWNSKSFIGTVLFGKAVCSGN